jgi:hypothetical protein
VLRLVIHRLEEEEEEEEEEEWRSKWKVHTEQSCSIQQKDLKPGRRKIPNSVKRDLRQCQKRPKTVSKET